ncbi:MAG: hypothetical protein ACRC1K_11850 [Planctomycetia bacterium]
MSKARQSKRKSSESAPSPYEFASVFDDPPRKNVFLLSCMDQRLSDDTVHFMNALNLHNRYDHLALAGGAMGVHRLSNDPAIPSASWWNTFTGHLSAAIDVLHRPIKDVFLIDHLDCGAYKHLHPDDTVAEDYRNASLAGMTKLHANELRMLACRVRNFCEEQRRTAESKRVEALRSCTEETACLASAQKHHDELIEAWTGIRVSYFLMDLRGDVAQLDLPVGETDALER